jgi:hypothetical protein
MEKNLLLVILVLGFFSCQKEISSEVANTNTSTQVDVYVAGYVADLSAGIPAYWKNGRLVLIDSAHYNVPIYYGLSGAGARSITVSGNNVYLGGYEVVISPYSGDHYPGICWKNGIPVDLTDGSTPYISSIIVSGTDVYVAGSEGGAATYWKNGSSPVYLTIGGGPSVSWASATSIVVSGTDVYVAGYEENYGSFYVAKYWKNGTAVNLPSDGTKNVFATSIAVSGNDVYVAGYEATPGNDGGVAKYWKNGNPVNLSDVTNFATANSIAVSGTDVYVTGYENSGLVNGVYTITVAKYWKNGNPVNLTDGSKLAEATSIAISGNDVYVAGYEEKTAGSYTYVAKYWKNGSPVVLGDVSKYSDSKASSIFLVKK